MFPLSRTAALLVAGPTLIHLPFLQTIPFVSRRSQSFSLVLDQLLSFLVGIVMEVDRVPPLQDSLPRAHQPTTATISGFKS